jgi:hypothetical protein
MTKWVVAALLAAEFWCIPAARAQEIDLAPQRGSHEMTLWMSQSSSLGFLSSGVNGDLFQIGGRYGLVLTGPHGRGPLRGQFEYAVDFIPVIVPFQSSGTTYGIGLDPIVMKWNLQPRRRVMPYAEIGAGGMATFGRVPPTGSYWNFTASGGMGVQVLRGRYIWSIDCRFYHISDAYIVPKDPTFNTIQLRVGFGIFHHRK